MQVTNLHSFFILKKKEVIKMTSATTKFIKLPSTLLYKYNELSIEAKYLYAFLLDRHSLSIKKHILDKNNEPYVICTQQEASELLNISIGKVVAVFKDLEQHSLITRIKQGQGKPARIYVNNTLAKSSFIKIPKDCSNAILNKLSIAELVLYALLKSKTEKSQINNWIENNQVFVSYKQSKIAEIFNMGKKKVIAMFKSLVTNGLIKIVRCGHGRTSKIFFTDNNTQETACDNQTSKKSTSKMSNSATYQTCKNDTSTNLITSNCETSNIDTSMNFNIDTPKTCKNDTTYTINKTNKIKTDLSITEETVKNQIDYKAICRNNKKNLGLINYIVSLLVSLYTDTKDCSINSIVISADNLKSSLKKLRSSHIEKIINRISGANNIFNLKKYLTTCLYTQGVSVPDCCTVTTSNTSYDITAFERYDIFD